MNNKAKNFLAEVRKLNINARLSPDKSFVIFEPTLPNDMIQEAIDLSDDLCIILDNESLLLSNEDADLINSLIDNDDNQELSTFKLSDIKPVEESNLPIIYEEMTNESFDRDFDLIRKNLKDIIKSGTVALNRIILVAEASSHPRAYEVVATLIKALAEANKDLLDAHRKKIETNQLSGTPVTNNNIQNNNVFVGSTAELSKFLKGKKSE